MNSKPNTQQSKLSNSAELSKLLNISQKLIIKVALDNNLDADALTPDDCRTLEMKLAQANVKLKTLNGEKAQAEPKAESFSIEDSEDFLNWDEVISELGDETTALALVSELGMSQDAITYSDLAALKELALTNPVHQNLANHIAAVGSVGEGFVNEHIRREYEKGTSIAEAGNVALMTGMLQTQLDGLEQTYQLQTLINQDLKNIINSHLENLGAKGKEKPNKTVHNLGKQATVAQQSSQKTSKIRTQKLDVIALKKSLTK